MLGSVIEDLFLLAAEWSRKYLMTISSRLLFSQVVPFTRVLRLLT